MPLRTSTPIVAIIYEDGRHVAPVMAGIATHLRRQGCSLAGLLQYDVARPGKSRCDMVLEDLASGRRVAISDDRGSGARGCRLDVDALLAAMGRARAALESRPDLLLVNKFGKTECEGGGLRPLIVSAMEREVPTLVAVPSGNLAGWRAFAGDLAAEHRLSELPDDPAALVQRLGLQKSGHHTSAGGVVAWPAA